MQALKQKQSVDSQSILHEQLALERLKRVSLVSAPLPKEPNRWFLRASSRVFELFGAFNEKELWNQSVEAPREWR
jgi:hypothetical protein